MNITIFKTNQIPIFLIVLFISGFCSNKLFAVNDLDYIKTESVQGGFPILTNKLASPVFVAETEFEGVIIAAKNLQADIERVGGVRPQFNQGKKPEGNNVIIIGTIQNNPLINQLVQDGKIDISSLKGKWETFLITVVENPVRGVDKALVIVGSDKRGAIYGIYDVSEKIGVSPWNWWADVPVEHQDNLFVVPGKYTLDEPAVKYRGIFINDEAPALTEWVFENFGDFNHKFYIHVFELILRLKGNFLWPAMWGRSLFDDDSLSPVLADKYGIVLSTSHHEPLMRSHIEWSRYGKGQWNYDKNPENLQEFWKKGIERMGDYESLVTIGMRGDGDEAMTEGTAIGLMEKIVEDQRNIIAEVTGKPAEETPQVWALYKEVQDYYDKGMRVPDDVTLLLCDDNWGNVRVLPGIEDNRAGGFGMYYHFDFVGGPRNYKWLNVTQIERVWEQMRLCYDFGVEEIWLVNVGDIKPMEFPISFFLDYAWNPNVWPAKRLSDYYTLWSEQQFGPEYAKEIGEIISLYTKYNSRKTPEMLSAETYSIINYNEAERIVYDYNKLLEKALNIGDKLPEEYHDAYFQLVLFPVQACANLNELYFNVAKNRLAARQNRASTNDYAQKVKELFDKDAEIANYYHTRVANGKWNHIASQVHIGYTYWQQPDEQVMPKVEEIKINNEPGLGVAVENSVKWYPEVKENLYLPEFDPINNQSHFIEIFNRGKAELEYKIEAAADFILIDVNGGKLEKEKKITLRIDWDKVPNEISESFITVSANNGESIKIVVPINNTKLVGKGFIENNGVTVIEASNYTDKFIGAESRWEIVPNLGRTGSAVTTVPVTASRFQLQENSPRLEYEVTLLDTGNVELITLLSPTLNFKKADGFLFAVSIDNEEPQIVNMHASDTIPDWFYPSWWNNAVSDHIRKYSTTHYINKPGKHTLKYWMIDSGIVLQRFILNRNDSLKDSYLGPEESKFVE
ncbi:MAG: glycosyl hydrolase 115 family protein [Bacteroidales bacterium]|nr:glycosyl hydrolase 115 family protein [Bacteroidales bacterium]MBN2819527.1 glycosyl hydrolase 115 family protein [Bacteroidales bacterium]